MGLPRLFDAGHTRHLTVPGYFSSLGELFSLGGLAMPDKPEKEPQVERRKQIDRRKSNDRRDGDRVVPEGKPRRQKPDRRKN